MKTKYIDVDGSWGIIVCYGFDMLDWDEMAAVMDAFGMDEENIRKAIRILSDYNTGLCISRSDLRMSCIFVSKTTSRSQFWDTLEHELTHAAVSIIDYYDEPYNDEPAAYLSGYLMRRAVEEIAYPCV